MGNLTPATEEQIDEPTCMVCTDILVNSDPVVLVCGPIFCRDCVHKCEPSQAEAFLFGLDVVGGTYVKDLRYTPYENFERSLGDLDMKHARDSTETILTNIRLGDLWDALIAGAQLEDESSTAEELQPVLFPEMQLVRNGLRHGVHRMRKEEQQPMQTALNMLMKGVLYEVQEHMSDLKGYVREADKTATKGMAVRSFLRPGLEAFVERTVSRMLNMVVLRKCEDPKHARLGCHKHSVRDFYVQAPKTKQEPQPGSTRKRMREGEQGKQSSTKRQRGGP